MKKNNILAISFIPYKEFQRIKSVDIENFKKLQIISDMSRFNALSAVKKAGSGHLGSSFSSLDIVAYLYFYEMNIIKKGIDNPDRDIYFSSKGHDCPGLYSILAAAGILDFDLLFKLRRLKGLPGHPDIVISGIEANSGSLGMGISKAKGMALAKKMDNRKGRIFVMCGDGEFQEGQTWEALQTAAAQKISNINVIVDHNKIQTDKPIKKIIDFRDLEKKFKIFGWETARCDGHNFRELEKVFKKFRKIKNKPKVLIADTIKGKGVSFMEGKRVTAGKDKLYQWHSGAPDDDSYEKGCQEIFERINKQLSEFGLRPISIEVIETRERYRKKFKDTAEKVVEAYSRALVELGEKRKDIIVLDADLSADCGLRPFEQKFPGRFVENGIAEQDMVSMAGGLALQGFLPIVNSFGAFLSSRANEQIYNNATENTKIIYVCHYAGLIPAGPGKSHQSLRDISLFGALPNCIILEPCNGAETKMAFDWCVNQAKENCMLRLVISPSPRIIILPKNYKFFLGKGAILKNGKDAVMFAYGPVMLNEALSAAELLEQKGFSLKVVNMPWLNKVDKNWLDKVVGDCKAIFVLDNHFSCGGLGDCLLNTISSSKKLKTKKFKKFGIKNYPAWGTPQEVLRYHKLDGESLSLRILDTVEKSD